MGIKMKRLCSKLTSSLLFEFMYLPFTEHVDLQLEFDFFTHIGHCTQCTLTHMGLIGW